MTPLDEFVARWQAVMPLPYVDVINTAVEMENLPPQWGSALLTSITRNDTTIGSSPHVEETGEVIAALFAKAGTGSSLGPAMAALRKHFAGFAQTTPEGELHFWRVEGPQDIEPQAEGNWWRLAFVVPYAYWTRRAQPPVP